MSTKLSKVGATVKDVPAQEFIVALAAHFKKSQKLELPLGTISLKPVHLKNSVLKILIGIMFVPPP